MKKSMQIMCLHISKVIGQKAVFCINGRSGWTAVLVWLIACTCSFAQTVTLTPLAPINIWTGANTATNTYNVPIVVRETGGGATTNIFLNISGTNAVSVLGRIGTNNLATNNMTVTLVLTVTNAAKGVYPITVDASGDGVYSTNVTVFVVPQWAQTNIGSSGVWSDGAMWTTGTSPGTDDHVLFDHRGLGPWTNIVDTSRTIQTLIYLGDADDNGIANSVNTTINGVLTVVGTNGFVVGKRSNSNSRPAYGFFGNTLTVSNPVANFLITDTTPNQTRFVTVNMSNLNSLNVTVNRMGIADASFTTNNPSANSADGSQRVVFMLAKTNVITALFSDDYNALDFNTAIQYDRQSGPANNGGTGSDGFFLGITNSFYADSIGVGRGGAVGSGSSAFTIFGYQMRFNPSFTNSIAPTSAAYFRNTNGGRMSLLAIGVDSGRHNLGNNRGIVDLRGGVVDMLVDQVWVARNRTNSGGSDALGGLYFDSGTIDANILRVGNYQFTNAGAVSGYVLVGGGSNAVLTVNKYIELGRIPSDVTGFETPAAAALGQIQIRSSGTVRANAIICGTNSALNNQVIINTGGSLVLTNTVGDSTNKLSVLNVNRSSLTFHLDGAANITNIQTKSIVFAGSPNVINISTITNLVSIPQRFTLIAYDAASAAPAFTKGSTPLGFNAVVGNSGAGAGVVYIDITTNVAKTLIWRGYQNSNWDHSSTNWWDPVALTFTNAFNDGDFVVFDDSALGSTISITENISPGQAVNITGVTVTNNSLNYTFNGGGGTIGLSGLVKSGTAGLAMNLHTELSVRVDQGIVLGNGDLGAVTVASGAALSFSGNINGVLSCSGVVTNSGTVNASVSVGDGGQMYNIGIVNGPFSVGNNALFYNQGQMLNIGATASVGTNSLLWNTGKLIGGGLSISGTWHDSGAGQISFTNTTTINAGGVFTPGNVDANSAVTIAYTGTAATRSRVLLANGSTNIFGVDAGTLSANRLVSFSVDFGNNNTLAGGGGVIVITNLSATPFAAGQSFRLFENYLDSDVMLFEAGTNTAPVIEPPAPGPGLVWDTRTLRKDGRIKILTTGTSLANYNYSLMVTNLILFTGFTTNNDTLVITTNYSTNKSTILNFDWPQTNVGWRLQQQFTALTNGLRQGPSNWTYIYPTVFTNTVWITNGFAANTNGTANGSAVFYRLAYP